MKYIKPELEKIQMLQAYSFLCSSEQGDLPIDDDEGGGESPWIDPRELPEDSDY